MAFRRSVASRAKIIYQQQQRLSVPFSHIGRDDDGDREGGDILRRRLFGSGVNTRGLCGSRNMFHDRRFAAPAALAPFSARNMSTFGEGAGADKLEIITDVLGETAAEAASQVANEVAVAAADSFLPVAALQYLIDYVHTFTGLDWWASIVVTTILMRTLQLPLNVYQIKASSKFHLIKPQLEEIQEDIRSRDMDPAAMAEGQARMKKLFNDYGVTPFTPFLGMLIVGPVFCCFFFAINNMAEKVQSFKTGGALWFTDLTTPDALYIFPVLTALTFWITVECNALEGLEGNPSAKTIKNVSRGFAALTIPLTVSFPKALFCFWITTNLYSLAYGLVMKNPEVKKMLGIPDIPPPSTSTSAKPAMSLLDALKKYAAAQQQQPPPPQPQPPFDSSSKHANPRISSTSVLNQRIKTLEKEVKGRKKGKKR